MPEQYKCRFCGKSYNEVLAFLDHFETHMRDNGEAKNKQENVSYNDKSLEFINTEETLLMHTIREY